MSQRAVTLNRSPWQGVFYLTGGGSGLLAELLGTPGASRTVLEVVVPYAAVALAELLGRAPEQACSHATARALAMAAFQRARSLQRKQSLQRKESLQHKESLQRRDTARLQPDENAPPNTFGLGCTASLATDRTKRGKHRAYVAMQTEASTYTATLLLEGDRNSEERTLVDMLWHALSRSLDLNLETPPPENFDSDLTHAQAHWRALILDEARAHATRPHDGKLLFPGAFNPLHHAHERMLEIAEAKTGLTGAYELSLINVDKPLLDYTEIESRLQQFSSPVWLTRLPTFLDKARYFPGAHFIVGADTLLRIVDPRYYAGVAARDAALAELADLGCRFIVFGRTLGAEFRSLSDLQLPGDFAKLCTGISEAEFHEPISSTELRQGQANVGKPAAKDSPDPPDA